MKQRLLFHSLMIAVITILLFSPTDAGQRHWVGSGSGNGKFWDRTGNWSATKGGASGAAVPTASDSVFIDSLGTFQVNTNAVCLYFNQSVNTGTKDFINNSTLTVGA